MRIQNVTPTINRNPNLNPQFQEKLIKVLTAPMAKTSVSNGLTELDKFSFRTYMNSKQYAMGLTHGEINALTQYKGKEFITRAYKFITRKLAISGDIAPKFKFEKISGDGSMCYDSVENTISVDFDKVKNSSKATQFGALRHEIQHFFQSVMMLRHEDIGEKFADSLIDICKKCLKLNISDYVNNTSVEEFATIFKNSSEPDAMMDLVKSLKSGDKSRLNKIIDIGVGRYKQTLNGFRENIVKQYGIIKKESSLTPEIQKYLEDSMHKNYHRKDGSIDMTKYHSSIKEQDAMAAQDQATFEFSESKCFMNFYKKTFENILNDESFLKNLNN